MSAIKKLFWLLLILASAIPARASIAAIYYAPTSAGSNNGTSCANAYAYNDGTNGWTVSGKWGSGSTQVGAGTTIHVCPGTWTFGAGVAGLSVLGSGSSGNPITIIADQGAVTWQSPYFGSPAPFGGCSIGSCLAAIEIYNQNYVTVDGNNGAWLIQNTADGTGLANQVGSMHIYGQGDHIIIRGIDSERVYVNGGAATGASDTGGQYTANIYFNAASTNLAIYNVVANSSRIGILADIGSTTGPNSCPTPNGQIGVTSTPPGPPSGNFGICIYNDTLSDHAWQMNFSGPATANIFACEYGDNTVSNGGTLPGWLNWQYPISVYHQNGIFGYNSSSGSNVPVTMNIYGIYDHGDLGSGSPTAHLSCNTGNNGGCAMTAFNDIVVQTASAQNPGNGVTDQLIGDTVDSSWTYGPFKYYNNTLVGGAFALEAYTNGTNASPKPTFTWENNIWYPTGGAAGGSTWYTYQPNSGNWLTIGTIDYNDYYGANAASGVFVKDGTAYASLSVWATACSCEAHSVLSPPNLSSTYRLNGGAPGIGLGTNLSSLSITALNVDAAGNARPGSGSWDAGAYEFQTTPPPTWNPGVTISGLLPPTNLTATVLQ